MLLSNDILPNNIRNSRPEILHKCSVAYLVSNDSQTIESMTDMNTIEYSLILGTQRQKLKEGRKNESNRL